ncbi:transposase [Candidatus Poribacteria bacterium]|nr:transposase [Candidatus Poribacteria bacterium]
MLCFWNTSSGTAGTADGEITPKRWKPYRYFLVFTTDLTLEIPKIIEYYQHRWQIETAFRDVKQHFGFSGYQVKSRKSINRFVQLSFTAASLTKLIFTLPPPTEKPITVKTVCEFLGIHWYHPKKLTQGLRVAYLQAQIRACGFSTSSPENTNSQNINTCVQKDRTLPFDKAA